jgi:hypothetical protein
MVVGIALGRAVTNVTPRSALRAGIPELAWVTRKNACAICERPPRASRLLKK